LAHYFKLKNAMNTRRIFLKKATFAGLGASMIPAGAD
jgi:hypothetical protein